MARPSQELTLSIFHLDNTVSIVINVYMIKHIHLRCAVLIFRAVLTIKINIIKIKNQSRQFIL